MVNEVIQAGLGTGKMVFDIINSVQQMKMAKESARRSERFANIERSDTLRQRGIENSLAGRRIDIEQQNADLSRSNAAFQKKTWSAGFRRDQQRYKKQLELAERARRDGMRDKALQYTVNAINMDESLKNNMLSRLAV